MNKSGILSSFLILLVCEFLGSVARQYSKSLHVDFGFAVFWALISATVMFFILKFIVAVLNRSQSSELTQEEPKKWHYIVGLIFLILLLTAYPWMVFGISGVAIVITRMFKGAK